MSADVRRFEGMCGRYAATANPDELTLEFEVDDDRSTEPTRSVLVNPQSPPPGTPDTNMAPTKQAPVVLTRVPRGEEGAAPLRQLRLLTWGLVPSWSKDPKSGVRMINARAESVLEKPAYAKAAARRRCLVPARGWYEWQVSPTATDAKGKPLKQPFFTSRDDGASCAFAGLYEFWRDPAVADSGDPAAWLTTFTIITSEAEPGLDRIHDRQPLVLDRADWEAWLDPELTDPAHISDLLTPRAPGRFTAYPVSRAVSSNRSNGPQLLEPLPASELQGVVDPATGEIIGSPS
jgi:putative SOS response-associated peptidase YedK